MITARLSRRFYDKFGDEIVNELVEWLNQVDLAFRTELRETNERNFQRSDARLEQRLAEFGAEFRGEIATLKVELKSDIQAVRGEIKDLRAELIKWMFLFWAGTVLPVLLLK